MLLNFLTLATDVSTLESDYQIQFMYSFTPGYRFAGDMNLPVISNESEKSVIPLPWGIQFNPERAIRQYWIPVEGILKNPASRGLIRTRRCAVLTNCYYMKNQHEVLLLYKPSEPVLWLAGIWNEIKKPGEPAISGFAILTRPAPPKLAPLAGRVPVVLTRSRVRGYLNVKKPLMDISWILREVYYPGLNGHTIDPSVIGKNEWSRKDLLPSGKKFFSDNKLPEGPILNTRNYFWR